MTSGASVRTTCPYCGVGCGVSAQAPSGPEDAWRITGDPEHPANVGRLCSKGARLGDVLDPGPRLLTPRVDGHDATWATAIQTVAERLTHTIETHGPGAVAFYVSGQLLTEDYYVVNKLAKGFIGTPHVDTNSRLCMASTVAGHKRAFGEDVVPGSYEDLDCADLIVLVGSNLAWCHPILHRRVEAAMARGTKLVVIDPRRTDSCIGATLHLPLRPGSDVALFNGLLAHLAKAGVFDRHWLERHVSGCASALKAAQRDMPHVAEHCGLSPEQLTAFYALFTAYDRVVTVFSQGVNQSSAGTDKVNAILNVHLATGRIGRPGSGPFSVTGQPNAMGGREVGGLANQLAAHMSPDDPEDVDRVRRFWQAPNLRQGQGLKAVDLFRAIGRGEIKALWVMATNPAVSLPDSAAVRAALDRCPTVILSDVVAETDTATYADILLPAAAWGEKDGTVTNSERRISRQRPLRSPVGHARPDWKIMTDVAVAMGHGTAFAYDNPAAIFREHAALSAFENDGARVFDIGALAGVDDAAYDALDPTLWPCPVVAEGDALPYPMDGSGRLFANGPFPTPSGRAAMVPVSHRPAETAVDERYPLILNTGRYRDQWHTMTRTGLSAALSGHRPEPLVDMHPDDARASGLEDGGLVTVESTVGAARARLRISDAQHPGQVFFPIHWTDQFALQGVVSTVIGSVVDPISGQPDSKIMPVRVSAVAEGTVPVVAVTPSVLPGDGVVHWVRQTVASGWIVTHLSLPPEQGEIAGLPQRPADLSHGDPALGRETRLWLTGAGDVEAVLYRGRVAADLSVQWIAERCAALSVLSVEDRIGLLAGRPPGAIAATGRLVCSCQSVGLIALEQAIADGADSVEALMQATTAGTGCGSCRAELAALLPSMDKADVGTELTEEINHAAE